MDMMICIFHHTFQTKTNQLHGFCKISIPSQIFFDDFLTSEGNLITDKHDGRMD